jgi:hypothetical protein
MTGIKTGNKNGKRRGLIVQPRDLAGLREFAVMRVADREQFKIAAGFGSTTLSLAARYLPMRTTPSRSSRRPGAPACAAQAFATFAFTTCAIPPTRG